MVYLNRCLQPAKSGRVGRVLWLLVLRVAEIVLHYLGLNQFHLLFAFSILIAPRLICTRSWTYLLFKITVRYFEQLLLQMP